MKKITLKLKKILPFPKKKMAPLALVFLTILELAASQLVFPLTAQAAEPQFNIYTPYVHSQTYQRDYYLLDVKNETKNTEWNFPVSADAGDTLIFYLYYHNGVNNTIANNTTLRVNLPSGQSTQQTVTGYLWADNATNATAANPMSQSVQANLSSSQTLQYISGTAKWFPNQGDWRTAAPTAFPSGQNENQLFSSGINLGSIEGCWEFSGAIVFKAKVGNNQPPTSTYSISTAKTVRNLTTGQGSFAENANASNNDRLIWQIQITNTGNTTLNNAVVRDTLPSYISYVYGSARLDGGTLSDSLISGGVNVGSLSVGSSRNITFETLVNSSGTGNVTITNYGYARADQTNEVSDSATVYISSTAQGNLNITKSARNITANQTGFSVSVNANAGDRILFLIEVSTPVATQPVTNVRVWDILPSGLNYVSGSSRLDGSYTSDNLVSSGINLGTMSANQSHNLNLEATVSSIYGGYTGGSQTLINYGYVSADSLPQRSAFAQVVVGQAVTAPSNVTKKVENLTSPNGTNTDNNAAVGDVLRYTLTYTNSSATLTNAQFIDILPSYVAFRSADNNGYYNSANNQITWNIGTLAANSSATVSYQVTVQNVPYNGFIVANTAAFKADNLALINSNEVRTTVSAGVVKGAAVRAVTGGDNFTRNLTISIMASLWFLFFLYLVTEHTNSLHDWRLKLAVWQIRRKENL